MILVSQLKGVVTESQRLDSRRGSEEQYIIRSHQISNAPGSMIDVGLTADRMMWTGFRYRNAEWSFTEVPKPTAAARDGHRAS